MDQTNNDSSKVEKVMDSHGSTALFLAIASGSLNDVKCLHEAGADMSCKNEEGDTLLNRAVTLGFIDIVAYLLKNAKLDPNLKGMCGRMAIQNAIEICNIDILTLLIDHGAKWHESFIIQLARSGNADIINKIMDRYYVKLNYRHTDGKSALMVAVENSNIAMIRKLMHHRVTLCWKDHRGHNAFHTAVRNGNVTVLNMLIRYAEEREFGDVVNRRDWYLGRDRCMCVHGYDNSRQAFHFIEVDRALDDVFHSDMIQNDGPLDVASYGTIVKSGWGSHPSPDIVHKINERYAYSKVTSATPKDFSALTLAIYKRKTQCALLLLNNPNVSTDISDNFGLTPLHFACMRGDLKVVRKIVQRCVDIKDDKGRTPLQIAKLNRHHDVVSYLSNI